MAAVRDPQPRVDRGDDDRSQRRARQLLLGLACAYGVALALMYAFGVFAFVWKTAVVPALLAVAYAARRFTPFVRDWAVFLAAIALFDSMRGLIYGVICRYSLRVYMGYAIDAEEFVFGAPPPSARLQAALFAGQEPGWLERLLVALHASHFLVFLFFGLALWLLRPSSFARFRVAMLIAMFGALIGYLCVPTVPPWMAAGRYHVIEPIAHVPARLYTLTIPTLAQSFDVNPVAAMPSLHAAFPALLTLFAFEAFGVFGWAMLIYALAVWFAIVALGEHYAVDVLAGLALATLAYLGARFRGPRVRADGASAQRELVRPLLLAAGLLVLAQATGLLARAWAGQERPSPAFIEAELDGKSPTAAYYRGLAALAVGDYARAQSSFERAKTELPTVREQLEAYARLAESAFLARDFATVTRTLGSLPQLSAEQSLMLAEARLALGQRALGFEVLDQLRAAGTLDAELRARAAALEGRYRR